MREGGREGGYGYGTQNDLQVNPEKLVARLTMNLTGTINPCQPTLDTDNLGQYQYC